MATTDDRFFDSLEVRNAEMRQEAHLGALPELLSHALDHAPAMSEHLGDVDPAQITSLDALAELPILRKSEFIERQRLVPPFAGMNATPLNKFARVFASPGPIFEPQGDQPDYWRFARAMFAAGIRAGDLVHNSFAYHLTPGGFMMESGARALGCPVIPAGTGQTDQQLQVNRSFAPICFCGHSYVSAFSIRAWPERWPPSRQHPSCSGFG